MVFFLSLLLYISVAGMLGMLVIKRWEFASGRVLAASVRPKIAQTSHEAALWVKQAPLLLRHLIVQRVPLLREALRHWLAQAWLRIEQTLERTLHTLQRGTVPQVGNAPVSDFLREVAEYKRKLAATVQQPHSKE